MNTAIIVLYVYSALLTLTIIAVGWYCSDLAKKHAVLNDALIAYADGVVKIFENLRVVTIREKVPADTVFQVETPKGMQ